MEQSKTGKQYRLDGTLIPTNKKCGDCKHFWVKTIFGNTTRRFGKCDLKPRGFGYDLNKNHENCPLWTPKEEDTNE